jgi:hypothetical protein
MRNRAKCKLCGDILESFHRYDCVSCRCGEISIDGGNDYCRCAANDWKNFLRVDDEGNEIVITVVEKDLSKEEPKEVPKPTQADLLSMLQAMITNIEQLPPQAMTQPITHYDLYSALLLINQILLYDSTG